MLHKRKVTCFEIVTEKLKKAPEFKSKGSKIPRQKFPVRKVRNQGQNNPPRLRVSAIQGSCETVAIAGEMVIEMKYQQGRCV